MKINFNCVWRKKKEKHKYYCTKGGRDGEGGKKRYETCQPKVQLEIWQPNFRCSCILL